MADMEAIFSVTDAYGIHREKVSVPLGKEDPGAVRRLPSGEVEIVVPEVAVHDWLSVLREGLEKLGFQRVGESQE
jgi:hypothetical protein